MKRINLSMQKKASGIVACMLIAMITMSFEDTPYVSQILDTRIENDTVPDKFSNSTMKMQDFDKLMKDLDLNLDNTGYLQKADVKDILKNVETSLAEIDINEIMKNVQESLNKIDMTELMADVELSLKNTDWKKTEGEMNDAMKAAKKEMENARIEISKIDKQKIEKDLQGAREDLKKAAKEIKEIDVEKIMKESKESINKAHAELKGTKEMFREMEKDGLISAEKGFSIELSDNELYINDVKQSQQVADKYRKYIKGDHFKIKIEKE